MHRSMLAKDECAFHEGDVGDRFYIIEEGRTSVQVDGKEINQLQPGECFAETSLLTGEPRNATVRCVSTSCRLLSMDVSAFSRLIRRSNKLQTELSSLAATRVLSKQPQAPTVTREATDTATHVEEGAVDGRRRWQWHMTQP